MPKGTFKTALVPLTFTYEGSEHTYSGRGRHSRQLSAHIATSRKYPVMADGAWTWRDATDEEVATANAVVERMAAKATAKATKAEAVETEAVTA